MEDVDWSDYTFNISSNLVYTLFSDCPIRTHSCNTTILNDDIIDLAESILSDTRDKGRHQGIEEDS
jgi:hypothetical protein